MKRVSRTVSELREQFDYAEVKTEEMSAEERALSRTVERASELSACAVESMRLSGGTLEQAYAALRIALTSLQEAHPGATIEGDRMYEHWEKHTAALRADRKGPTS